MELYDRSISNTGEGNGRDRYNAEENEWSGTTSDANIEFRPGDRRLVSTVFKFNNAICERDV